MEHVLLKIARQLDALDEASLVALWDKYSTLVARFEPSKRWEEGVLIFSLIQAKRWKNQLFNQQWAERSRPGAESDGPRISFTLEQPAKERPRAKVLAFKRSNEAAEDSDN